MKKLILFTFMLVYGLSYGQTYTVYDCGTLRAMYNTPYLPTDPATCYTTAIVMGNWAIPTYDPVCVCFFNAATPEQQEYYLAAQQAASVGDEDLSAINDAIMTPQTDSQLNALYSNQRESFRLLCPKVEFPGFVKSQTEYIKNRDGSWSRALILKNIN